MTAHTDSPLGFSSAQESRQVLSQELAKREQQLMQLRSDCDPIVRAELHLDIAEIMLEIAEPGMQHAAWGLSRDAFKLALGAEQWETAVKACDVLYRVDLPASIPALGNGIWLAVTYPIDPSLSILMLNHLIDATPEKADGAAIAAAVAHYLADVRLEGEKRESMMFLTSALLGKVAERHSQVQSQAQMNLWMNRLQLLEPAVFLPRLGQVLEAIVEGQWWYDRELLRSRLPT